MAATTIIKSLCVTAITLALAGALDGVAQAHNTGHNQNRRTAAAARHHIRHRHKRQLRVELAQGGRGGDPGDDYPTAWRNRPKDSVLDNWSELNRECTSFAAWALSTRDGFTMPFHDNAINWGPRALARGYAVNGTPAPGSIAWSNRSPFGHVAYVESVSGISVSIEEYNHDGNGTYDARTVPSSAFTAYIHFKDISSPSATESPSTTVQGSSPNLQGSSSGVQGSSPNLQGGNPAASGGGNPPESSGGNPPGSHGGGETTWSEQEGHYGVNTFTDPYNASGMAARIAPAQVVQVSCRVYAPQIESANPDGWWYRIQSGPWSDAYYSPANTFMNGDPWNGPYTHNTDWAVAVC
jgi:surface antigen